TCIISSFVIFTGYYLLALTYNGYLHSKSFLICSLYLLLVGMASAAGYLSSLTKITKDLALTSSKRGIALGTPLGLFGLSAFMFSQNQFIPFQIGCLPLSRICRYIYRTCCERDHNKSSFLDICGWDLVRSGDARLLFIAILFIGGTALMYINNVGNIIKSLYAASVNCNPPSNVDQQIEIHRLQNFHVSIISIFSCVGRLTSGLFSDFTKYV
ncbi:16544_t:CDS:2, partial [Acaulospora morrowiae]